MILPIEVLIALVVWGTLVGVDLVSLPQMMIARPLVAGTVAGAILGDIPTGLKLGVVFELLQYDILPVGAVRYPEYGPATVAAVATAHAAPGGGVLGLGLGALVGLVTGLLGGVTINLLRRVNSRIVHAAAAQLESGDPRALVRIHVGGLLRDALRAALVTMVGLVLAWLAPPSERRSPRVPRARCGSWDAGRISHGSPPVWAAAFWRRYGYGKRRARACVAAAVRRAGLVQLRAHARRGRWRRRRAAAARSGQWPVRASRRARRAFLQCASLSHRPRGWRGCPRGTRRRFARSDRAAAGSAVWPARLARRSFGLGWMAAVAVGTDDCGDRAWRRMVCGGGIPDRLQHRSRGASLVGALRWMDLRCARERRAAQPDAAESGGAARSGHGVRRRLCTAAGGSLPCGSVPTLGPAGRGGDGGAGVPGVALAQ